MAKIPFGRRPLVNENNERHNHYDAMHEQKEMATWKYVRETKDMKGLWDAINMKGEFSQSSENQLDVHELANICNKKP